MRNEATVVTANHRQITLRMAGKTKMEDSNSGRLVFLVDLLHQCFPIPNPNPKGLAS